MRKIIYPLIALVVFTSFSKINSLKGTWKYAGGYYNGKKELPTTGYQLQRRYTDTSFNAYLVEKGSEPEMYQAGKYTLAGDSCLETETFNSQSKNLTGVTLHYHYVLRHDTLYLKGHLPNGTYVLEYWKKIK